MSKWAHDDVLDAMGDYISTNGDYQYLCTDELSDPPTYTEVTSTYALTGAIDLSGDFTQEDGDVSGRQLTIAAHASQSITANGDTGHICIVDSGNSKVLACIVISTQAVTSGGLISLPEYSLENRDPI